LRFVEVPSIPVPLVLRRHWGILAAQRANGLASRDLEELVERRDIVSAHKAVVDFGIEIFPKTLDVELGPTRERISTNKQ